MYRKKTFLSIVFFILLCLFIGFSVLEGAVISCSIHSGPENLSVEKADAAIVLGHALDDSGDAPGEWLMGRLSLGLALYNEKMCKKIIVTGGIGKEDQAPVALYMADWLEARGVPEEDILIEDKATNTDENFYYSLPLAKQQGIGTIIVVTDDFHLFRSLETAKYYFGDAAGVGSSPPFGLEKALAYIKEPFSYIKHLFFKYPVS